MSSLLQMRGKNRTDRRRGVKLEFVLEEDYQFPVGEPGTRDYYEVTLKRDVGPMVPCHICGKEHPQIYTAWRKPKGMLGHWVVFTFNGDDHVPDLSIPIGVYKIPRGAAKLSPEENSEAWHEEC